MFSVSIFLTKETNQGQDERFILFQLHSAMFRPSVRLVLISPRLCFQSTASSLNKNFGKGDHVQNYPLLDMRFNQYRIAYRYRRSIELLRGYLVYRIFSIDFLVNNQTKVRNTSFPAVMNDAYCLN